jgi:hypothetical protein
MSEPMKRTATIVLTIVGLCSILSAQQKTSPQWGKGVLEVSGTKVRLGMTKGEVTERLAGTEISRINDNNWMVGKPEDLGPSLQFTDGRLNFADRYWVTHDNDITEALFGAVNSLNQQGFSACTVTAGTNTSPEMTAQNVWISCGEKSILVTRHSHADGKSYNMVYEQLGGMHDMSD